MAYNYNNPMGAPGYPGAPPPGQYGAPAPGQYGAPPAPGQYGAPPVPGQYGAPQPGPYGAPPGGQFGAQPPQAFGAPQPQQGAIDPTLQSWFVAVDADRSGRISAHELQAALVNGNWSHFNPETCRLMINMFDKDFSGTIDLHEFQALWHYIQQWKQTFERFDANRSGSIEWQELHQALTTMGYNLSQQFVNTIITKFDTMGRRTLTLDSFIQACVMLKSLTDGFRQRDSSMTGTVRMNYEDFMMMAILNKA